MLHISDKELNCKFANMVNLIYFITTCIESKQYTITEQELVSLFKKFSYLIEDKINKRHCINVAQLIHFSVKYCFTIQARLSPTTFKNFNKDPLSFYIQLAIIQMIPIFNFCRGRFKLDWKIHDIDEMRDSCIQKFCQIMNEHTFRLTHKYKEVLKTGVCCDYKIATKHIKYLLQTIKYYEDDAAVIIFQVMIYFLHDIIAVLKKDCIELEQASCEVDFFMTTLCLIKELIENVDITWTNCMESVYVANMIIDFLFLTT